MTLPHLPELPIAFTTTESDVHKLLKAYGQQCRDDLIELVKAVHKAKGRYHSQLAMCDLYDACGLPNQRPVK